jgi:hypothetical protein
LTDFHRWLAPTLREIGTAVITDFRYSALAEIRHSALAEIRHSADFRQALDRISLVILREGPMASR